MGDTIFGNLLEDDNEPQNDDTVTLSKKQFDELQTQLREVTQQLAQQRNAPPKQEAPPTPPPDDPTKLSADEAIKALADDPVGFSAKVADGRISQAVAEQLGPLLQPLIQTTHDNILGSERSRIDAILGVGKFDEIILPDLQKDIDSLRETNSAALSSQDTIKALVHRIEGQKRQEINKAEADYLENKGKADDELTAKVIQSLPPSMRPRPSGPQAQLDDDAKLFFEEIERATGERPDEKSFLALQNAKPGLQGYTEAMKSIAETNDKGANQ